MNAKFRLEFFETKNILFLVLGACGLESVLGIFILNLAI